MNTSGGVPWGYRECPDDPLAEEPLDEQMQHAYRILHYHHKLEKKQERLAVGGSAPTTHAGLKAHKSDFYPHGTAYREALCHMDMLMRVVEPPAFHTMQYAIKEEKVPAIHSTKSLAAQLVQQDQSTKQVRRSLLPNVIGQLEKVLLLSPKQPEVVHMEEAEITARVQCSEPLHHHVGLQARVDDLVKSSAQATGPEKWSYTPYDPPKAPALPVFTEESYEVVTLTHFEAPSSSA